MVRRVELFEEKSIQLIVTIANATRFIRAIGV